MTLTRCDLYAAVAKGLELRFYPSAATSACGETHFPSMMARKSWEKATRPITSKVKRSAQFTASTGCPRDSSLSHWHGKTAGAVEA